MDIKEKLVNLETAKLAAEKGFNIPCWDYFDNSIPMCSITRENYNGKRTSVTEMSRPTQSLLQTWLREVHNLHITIYSQSQESWMFRVTKQGQSLVEGLYGEDYENYEEALEDGLQEALNKVVWKQ